jgi:hypothetical protein
LLLLDPPLDPPPQAVTSKKIAVSPSIFITKSFKFKSISSY